MSPKRRIYLRFMVVMSLLGVTGIAATAFLLLQQRAPNPFDDYYDLTAEFTSADAVVNGLGQPVNVVGVKVGQVKDVELVDGRARVTLEIKRDKVPEVRRNATLSLQPITPLKDLQLELDPGRAPAPVLGKGELIGVGQTTPVVPLSDLLSVLDEDTRTFFQGFIASTDQGVAGRSGDLRRVLRSLGPTTRQAHLVAHVAAQRRENLARLVTNLARITRAATQDRRLAPLVRAGDQTLEAVASQDAALRDSLRELPPTLQVAARTLDDVRPFAAEARPALAALTPAVRGLPATLRQLRPFTDEATTTLRDDVRPLIRQARPLAADLDPVVRSLNDQTPQLTRTFRTLTYLTNELAYNPGGKNQGYLFWLSWAVHNFNSIISIGDAHGGIGRAQVIANCYGVEQEPATRPVLDLLKACPK